MKRTRVMSIIVVLSLVVSMFTFPCYAFDEVSRTGTTGYQVDDYTQAEIMEKIRNSPIENDYSAGIMPRASTTISSGGTVKVSNLSLQAGQTVTVRVTYNSAETLLFFYLMNSTGDICGPKTLDVDENLFVKPTGYTQMAPQSAGTWGLYIYNDGSTSTTLTYYVSY